MPTYESTGTIRCRVTNGKVEVVLFVPDDNHTVNRMTKKYAIFLGRKMKRESIVRELGDGVVSIRARRKDKNIYQKAALLDAAMKQSKVDVQVKCKRNGKRLNLVGITIPARQPAK